MHHTSHLAAMLIKRSSVIRVSKSLRKKPNTQLLPLDAQYVNVTIINIIITVLLILNVFQSFHVSGCFYHRG